jgi:hypothetical protein
MSVLTSLMKDGLKDSSSTEGIPQRKWAIKLGSQKHSRRTQKLRTKEVRAPVDHMKTARATQALLLIREP